jgi:hypothetical protein
VGLKIQLVAACGFHFSNYTTFHVEANSAFVVQMGTRFVLSVNSSKGQVVPARFTV